MKKLQENMLPANEDPIGILHRFTIKSEPILNKIFGELTNMSIIEIAGYNFDIVKDFTSEIEEKSRILERYASDYIQTQSDDDNWELEGRFDNARDEFNLKLSVIEGLVYELNKTQEYFIENDVLSKFPQIDITDIQ